MNENTSVRELYVCFVLKYASASNPGKNQVNFTKSRILSGEVFTHFNSILTLYECSSTVPIPPTI